MALDFVQNIKPIFSHSRDFNQGSGQVRRGSHTFIVALDGSGDYESIKEALAALPSGGGEIFIKDGLYNITSTLVVGKDNVAFIGSGTSTIITFPSSVTTCFSMTSRESIVFRNIRFRSPSVASTKSLDFITCKNCRVEKCYFESTTADNIHFRTTSNYNFIQNNYFVNCTSPITLTASNYNIIENNLFDPRTGDAGEIPIWVKGVDTDNRSTANIIRNNHIDGPTDTGIIVGQWADKNLIIGNIILDTVSAGGNGIQISSNSSNNSICSNILHDLAITNNGTATLISMDNYVSDSTYDFITMNNTLNKAEIYINGVKKAAWG